MPEHPQQLNITQSELAPRVADYFDTLLAQRDAILDRYHLTPETAERFCDLHTSDQDREKMLALYESMVYVIENKQIPPNLDKQEKYRLAQEIMQEDFLGIEAVEKTFNIQLKLNDIPDIPFTLDDLERAKELGQFLILRVDRTDDGTPLTMKQMDHFCADNHLNKGQGIIRNRNMYDGGRTEGFFTEETPVFAWALVSKDVLPNSTEKGYIEQTTFLVGYLTNTLFKGKTIPEPYASAISEYEESIDSIRAGLCWGVNPTSKAEAKAKLSSLAINRLTRHTPVEILYDLLIYFHHTGTRLLEHKYTWTSRFSDDEHPFSLGKFSNEGVYGNVWAFEPQYDDVGVSLSRKI